jgi:hypothetical protein
MGFDILGIIILAFIAIIIAALVYRYMPGDALIPTYVLIAVCVWIAYDYILMKKYESRSSDCGETRPLEKINIDDRLSQLATELQQGDDKEEHTQTHKPAHTTAHTTAPIADLKPKAEHAGEYDIAYYDESNGGDPDLTRMYRECGCTADNKMANRMKYMGMQPWLSQTIRARWNVEKYKPYLEEELHEMESRDWWDAENDYLDQFM